MLIGEVPGDVLSILSFGPVGKMGKRDVETDVVWAHNIDSAKDLVSYVFSRRISDTNKYCSFLLQTYNKTF